MRNKVKSISLLLILVAALSSCNKNEDTIFTQSLVEIDWAAYNARTSGYPFTLFTRVPQEPGRGVYNSANSYGGIDPVLNRSYADTIRMRINMVGPPLNSAQAFEIIVSQEFTTAIEGSATTPGAHFQLIDRTVTIPANQSFGFARWVVRNPGAANNLPVTVVFQLRGNTTVPVSQNYQYIGWSIAQ